MILETIANKLTKKPVKKNVTEEERHHMIEEAAYYHFQHRAFLGENHPLQDWLEAEVEIDRMLKS